MNLKVFCIPVRKEVVLLPQFLKPENKFERVVLISSYVLSKYYYLFRKLVPIQSSENMEFLRNIPIKTQKITLVHSLPEMQLKQLLSRLGKINARWRIFKSGLYFFLMPIVSIVVPDPLNAILELGISISIFKNIQQIRGSLVLERVFRENNFYTCNDLDLTALKDLDKFERENRIWFLKEKLER